MVNYVVLYGVRTYMIVLQSKACLRCSLGCGVRVDTNDVRLLSGWGGQIVSIVMVGLMVLVVVMMHNMVMASVTLE